MSLATSRKILLAAALALIPSLALAQAAIPGPTFAPSGQFLTGPMYVAGIGDSRCAQGASIVVAGGATVTRKSPISNCGWLDFVSGQRLMMPATYNQAVSGSLTSALQGQFNSVLALSPRPAFMEILSGTNDFGAGGTAVAAWANVAHIITQARAAGIIPICLFDLTRQLASWTAADAQQSDQFNQLLRQKAPGLGCIVVNANYFLADPANSGDPYTGYSPDGIHQTPVSAVLVANQVWAAAQTAGPWALQPPGAYTVAAADTYDATNNPYGNLATNPLLTGTAGTNSGTGASGTVPTGYQNRVLTGSATAVSSLVARADGKPGNCWQVVMTETGGTVSATGRMQLSPNITGQPIGAKLFFSADLFVTSATGLWQFTPYISDWNNGNTVQYDSSVVFNTPLIVSTNYPMPTSYQGRFLTDTITLNALTNNQTVRMDWTLAPSGTATVKVCAIEVRETP